MPGDEESCLDDDATSQLAGDNADMAQTVSMMERQFAQLKILVEDLMDVGAFRSSNVRPVHEHVNLQHVISDCLETCTATIDVGHHEVSIDSEETLVVRGDLHRLRQVFTNLLTNAIKYTPNGGHIAVKLAA